MVLSLDYKIVEIIEWNIWNYEKVSWNDKKKIEILGQKVEMIR